MRVKFIEDNEIIIVFLPDTLKFYQINQFTKEIIIDLLNGFDDKKVLEKYNLHDKHLFYIKQILNESNCVIPRNKSNKKLDILNKLVINIANTCNLACKYCYANGGRYSSDDCLMDVSLIDKILDSFFNQYREIKNIQLFGGEPTLNPDAIERVGQYISQYYNNGKIHTKTSLSIVTNGTLVDDRLIELVNKYDINVTISIDGPQNVNNKMRVFKDGRGTSEIVEQNIRKLKESTNQLLNAEVTYHTYHQEENISVYDLVSYLKQELKITNVHIAAVLGTESNDFTLKDKKVIVDSVKEVFNQATPGLDKSYSLINRVIEVLHTRKTNQYFCEAGISALSVSTNGDIYPCFMLIDIIDFKMGNIHDENTFSLDEFDQVYQRLGSFSKFNDEKCMNCFNNTICRSCIGMNYMDTGDIHKQSEENCEMFKSITEKVIIEITRRRMNDSKNKKIS